MIPKFVQVYLFIYYRYAVFCIMCLCCIGHLLAQNKQTIADEKVTVVREFNPLIQDASKINIFPTPPEIYTDKTDLQYSVLPISYQLVYSPMHLKPLALAKEKPQSYFHSYARAGFGTQWSPLAELFIAEGRAEKWLIGGQAKYRSANGNKIKSQDFSQLHASLFSDVYVKNSCVKTHASYQQNTNYYYAYDVMKSFPKLSKEQLRQTFHIADIQLQLLNAKARSSSIDYRGSIRANYLIDRYDLSEYFISGDLGLQKSINDKHHISMTLFEDYSVFNDVRSAALSRNIFSIKTGYQFKHKDWNLSGALNPVWQTGIFHFFPDIALQRNLFNEYITLFSGWKMELRKNSYLLHIQANPWLEQITTHSVKNGWSEERYTGLKGVINKFSYNLRFAQQLYRHMPVYINDTSNMRFFRVFFDRRTNMLNLHTELGYRPFDHLNFNLSFDFIHYEADRLSRIYHQPRFQLLLNSQYFIAEKIILQSDFLARDGVYALLPGNKEKQLRPTFDVNLSATYLFSNRFSLFVYLNNLASIKYEAYYLYPSYGFNMLAGITLHF